MLAEADSLVKAAFGSTMLKAIGKTYSSQANIFLGNFFEGSIAAIKSKSSSMKSQMHALGLAIQVNCLFVASSSADSHRRNVCWAHARSEPTWQPFLVLCCCSMEIEVLHVGSCHLAKVGAQVSEICLWIAEVCILPPIIDARILQWPKPLPCILAYGCLYCVREPL